MPFTECKWSSAAQRQKKFMGTRIAMCTTTPTAKSMPTEPGLRDWFYSETTIRFMLRNISMFQHVSCCKLQCASSLMLSSESCEHEKTFHGLYVAYTFVKTSLGSLLPLKTMPKEPTNSSAASLPTLDFFDFRTKSAMKNDSSSNVYHIKSIGEIEYR